MYRSIGGRNMQNIPSELGVKDQRLTIYTRV